jgi:hypothetical protein
MPIEDEDDKTIVERQTGQCLDRGVIVESCLAGRLWWQKNERRLRANGHGQSSRDSVHQSISHHAM